MTKYQTHIVDIYPRDLDRLKKWLERPNGSFRINDRLVFEAVGHGGVWVRTAPFRYRDEYGT